MDKHLEEYYYHKFSKMFEFEKAISNLNDLKYTGRCSDKYDDNKKYCYDDLILYIKTENNRCFYYDFHTGYTDDSYEFIPSRTGALLDISDFDIEGNMIDIKANEINLQYILYHEYKNNEELSKNVLKEAGLSMTYKHNPPPPQVILCKLVNGGQRIY